MAWIIKSREQSKGMVWWEEFNSAFFLTLSGSLFALSALLVKAALKSNCKMFSCCGGLFKCVRDTTDEGHLNDLEIQQGTASN